MSKIEEKNKLIAEFLGEENRRFAGTPGNYETQPYNQKWDWLMPALNKIGELGHTWQIAERIGMKKRNGYGYTCTILSGDCEFSTLKAEETAILSAWEAVVEFIKWYNENNN